MPSSLPWVYYDENRASKYDFKSTNLRHTRRSHSKSRNGCDVCRQRRLKCDQLRPRCGRCTTQQVDCSYRGSIWTAKSVTPQLDRQQGAFQRDIQSEPLQPGFNLSSGRGDGMLVEAEHSIKAQYAVFADMIDSMALSQGWIKTVSSRDYARVLVHFHKNTLETLSTPTGQRTIFSLVSKALFAYPYFLHTVLAVGSAHMTCVSACDMSETALFHRQQALRLYSGQLDQTKDRREMDALFATSLLVTYLILLGHSQLSVAESFTLADEVTLNPTVWWKIFAGSTKVLWSAEFKVRTGESQWLKFMQEVSESEEQVLTRTGRGEWLVDIVRVVICSRSSWCTHDENLFVLSQLAPLLVSRFDPELMQFLPCNETDDHNMLATFPGRLSSKFVKAIERRDRVALVLTGLWFALLTTLEKNRWWLLQRSLSEGRAILGYLKSLGSQEWAFNRVLEAFERAFGRTSQ